MAYRINKGADRPTEVLGIQGEPYLFVLAGSAVGLLLITSLVILLLPVTAWLAFAGYLLVVLGLYGILVRVSRRFGADGLTRYRARQRQPRVVFVRDSGVFRVLRQGGKPLRVNQSDRPS